MILRLPMLKTGQQFEWQAPCHQWWSDYIKPCWSQNKSKYAIRILRPFVQYGSRKCYGLPWSCLRTTDAISPWSSKLHDRVTEKPSRIGGMQAACMGVGRFMDIALRAWISQSSMPRDKNELVVKGVCSSSILPSLVIFENSENFSFNDNQSLVWPVVLLLWFESTGFYTGFSNGESHCNRSWIPVYLTVSLSQNTGIGLCQNLTKRVLLFKLVLSKGGWWRIEQIEEFWSIIFTIHFSTSLEMQNQRRQVGLSWSDDGCSLILRHRELSSPHLEIWENIFCNRNPWISNYCLQNTQFFDSWVIGRWSLWIPYGHTLVKSKWNKRNKKKWMTRLPSWIVDTLMDSCCSFNILFASGGFSYNFYVIRAVWAEVVKLLT